ncbi:MAG: tRNA (adenosine(37)-N6)-dimethylallyltransferase MiaA [Clostridia bacterium]|nr:tRNA (adenosine(37)-N6)-dimethylallyltransferase MiaA [Clostridia bacterium]
MKEKIICRVLTGPTASGKTALSLRLAEKHGWEIFCMDSMQIYRGMDIGTAKPTREERARVPHRMIDICDPRDAFSVAAYREQAEALVRQKAEEGREVLFVGGTGLYLQAMMHPMGMGSVPADETLRAELRALAATEEGKNRLHGMLAEIDPATAARLPVGDVRRTIRAIEVTRGTGIPFSMQPDREEESPFLWRVAATDMLREILYDRINRRVEQMIREGLAEEVRRLLEAGVPPESQSMQGLGYKEMVPYLRGEWPMDKAVEEIQKGSRHYAKRQGTFLRRLEGIRSVDALAADAAGQAETILA